MIRAEDLFFDLNENESIIVLSYIFNTGISGVLANKNRILTEDEFIEYKSIINKRKKGVPIQYAIGKWNFYGRDFIVDSRALIPRPETEGLVEWVVGDLTDKDKQAQAKIEKDGFLGDRLRNFIDENIGEDKNLKYKKNELIREQESLQLIKYNICDIGTGTGIIPITILSELENKNLHRTKIEKIVGADISEKAISIAKENDNFVLDSELQNKIYWIKSDLFENISDKFDIIISNPPYVEETEKSTLQRELLYEPQNALFAGIDGLNVYRRLLPQCADRLNSDGAVYLEIGAEQGESVRNIFIKNGFKDVEIRKDMAGRNRYVKAVK